MESNITTDNTFITRKQLYHKVWSTPITTLAKKYNISDNGLRKICIRLDIPLPKLGYWSKMKFNKVVKKIPLPRNTQVKQKIQLVIRDEKVIIEEHPQTAYYRLIKEIENSPNLSLKVPDRLTKPDTLIIAAQKDLKTKPPSNYYSNTKNIIYTGKGIVSIEVARENIPRSLRFMDTFIKLLKQRGHQIKVEGGTYAIIKGERVKLRFREVLKRITTKHPKYSWSNSELFPSGILSIKIEVDYNEKEWRDSAKVPLENKLPNILAKLELEADRLKKERIEHEIHQREYDKKRKIEEAHKARAQEEVNKFKRLKENAKRWKETVELRNYIQAVKNNAKKNNNLTEELKNWIQWATDKANWYDPIIQKEDEFFKNASYWK